MLLPHRLQVWGGIPISSQTQGVFRSVFTLRPNGNLLLLCKFATRLEHVQCIQRKNFGSLASLLPFGSFAYLFGLHAVEAWTCKTETCETLGRRILLLIDSDLFIPSPGCLQGDERGELYQHQFNSNCLPPMSIEHLRRLVLQDRLVPCPWPLRTQLIWFTAACHHNGWVENCSWIVFAMSIMHILGNFEADTPPSQHFAGSLTVCVVARWVWLKIVHLFTKLDGWIITTNSQQNFKRMTKGRTTRDPPNDWKNDRRNDQRRGQFGGSIPRRFLPFPVVPLFWAIWPLDDSQGAVPQMSSMSSSRLPPLPSGGLRVGQWDVL